MSDDDDNILAGTEDLNHGMMVMLLELNFLLMESQK